MRRIILNIARLLTLTVFLFGIAAAQADVTLTSQGKASLPIVIHESAHEQVKQAANTLKDYLGRISGASFELTTGDGKTGIVVGVVSDFPELSLTDAFADKSPAGRERYLLRSHDQGLLIIGATPLAAQHAVWDLLHRLGYRYFFPGERWEIIPNHPDLSLKIDVTEQPDYLFRRIWYGYGLWDHNREAYATWVMRNRGAAAFSLRTSHSWLNIHKRHEKTFEDNPAYYAQLEGKREYRGASTKFCLSNKALRELVVADRAREIEATPGTDSVSIAPSDGGGWCECAPCAAMGSVTDQLITLANEVASAIISRFGQDKYVALYAYNEHSPPPAIQAHPNVIINIATKFIRGYSVDELIQGWSEKASILGIREYYSVNTWDRDIPGKARGGDITYLTRTIPYFHSRNARFMVAEASDNWGPNGLGYYLAQRMLWNTDEAQQINELRDDFMTKAFGDAQEPMRRFYDMLDPDKQTLLSDDLVGRMYRLLQEAATKTTDPAVQQRLDDLTLYTHYVSLFYRYTSASGSERQQAFEKLIRHAYRMRSSMMIHTKALYRDLVKRDRLVEIPQEADWMVPQDKNPWKSSQPFERAELDALIVQGIEQHPLLGFQAVSFNYDLVPASSPSGSASTPLTWRSRGRSVYYTWVPQKPATIRLQVASGLIARYRNAGQAEIHLYPADEVEGLTVDQAVIPSDAQPHDIQLRTNHTGLHRIEILDKGAMSRITSDPGFIVAFESSTTYSPGHIGRQTITFYVPRGTKIVGGYATGNAGTLHDADGKQLFKLSQKGYFEVPVPPFVSHDASHLMLPADVLQADRP